MCEAKQRVILQTYGATCNPSAYGEIGNQQNWIQEVFTSCAQTLTQTQTHTKLIPSCQTIRGVKGLPCGPYFLGKISSLTIAMTPVVENGNAGKQSDKRSKCGGGAN